MAAEPGTHNSGQVHLSMKVGLHFAWATSEGCAEKHEREEEEEEEEEGSVARSAAQCNDHSCSPVIHL